MAITTAMTTSFKKACFDGEMDFSSDTVQVFKIALYTSSAALDASTTAYTTTGEVANGNGYTTGGATLTISTNPTTSGTTAYLNFSNVTWTTTSFTARGAMIYKYNGTTNPSVAVVDFGEDRQTSSANFVIQFPTADAQDAILRFS